jgi:hypothetical protein
MSHPKNIDFSKFIGVLAQQPTASDCFVQKWQEVWTGGLLLTKTIAPMTNPATLMT